MTDPITIEEILREAQELGIVLPEETTVLQLASEQEGWVVLRRDQVPLQVPFAAYKEELEQQGWSLGIAWWRAKYPMVLYKRTTTFARVLDAVGQPTRAPMHTGQEQLCG